VQAGVVQQQQQQQLLADGLQHSRSLPAEGYGLAEAGGGGGGEFASWEAGGMVSRGGP
jgi:hypothetical protein